MERLKIAIVGLNFGRHIVDHLRNGRAKELMEIAAVCDLDQAKANAMAAALGVRAYHSLEQVLADTQIPAVGLFTGPGGRAKLLSQIIRAGKDVMTTKPFELDTAAAMEVLHEAKQLGRVIHLNSPAPLLPPDLQQVRLWQEKYKLGRPIACRRATWASYRETANGTWYDDAALCPVAPIFRLGIYLINDLVRLLGEPDTVQVMHSRIFTRRPTPDNAQLGILFKNGAIANVFASFCIDDGQHYTNSMTLNFENGTIDSNLGPFGFGQANGKTRMSVVAKTGKEQTVIEHAEVVEGSGAYQWDTFYRAAKGERLENQTTPEEIVAGLKVIGAMARAERSGAAEKV